MTASTGTSPTARRCWKRLREELPIENTIRQVSRRAAPARWLRLLFETVTRHGPPERIGINILAAAVHPLVAPVVVPVFVVRGGRPLGESRRGGDYIGVYSVCRASRTGGRVPDAVVELLLTGSPRRGGM